MAFLSGIATGQASVVSCWHNRSDCKFPAFAFLRQRHYLLPHLVVYLTLCVIPSCHLWLIVGIWFYSFSITSLRLQAGRRSSLRRAVLTGAEGIYSASELPNSLFTFILASSCKLVFSASYSKSNPLLPFSPIWSWAHKAGEALRDSWVFKVSSLLNWFCTLPLVSSQGPAACWCLLPSSSTLTQMHLSCICDSRMQHTASSKCLFHVSITWADEKC